MRKPGFILLMAMLMVGCGAKKRASYTKVKHENAGQVSMSPGVEEAGTGYPMPEDKGEFIYFPIASIEEYISTFAPVAEFEMKAYGIPASITLAQGILESGYGQGELTRKTNNHFGIKCHTGWEGDYEHHDDDEKGECFRKYNHPMYSFRDHSIFLSSRARYAPLFELPKDDYKGWARGLKAAGYATDHHYPQKLISFIERYDLHRFDEEVMKEGGIAATPKAIPPTAEEYSIHIVQQGDTLYSLSRRYLTTVPELMQLNNMQSSSLSVGQQLRVRSQTSKK